MKKITIIGFMTALLIVSVLLCWQHFWLSDAQVYQKLTGTWVCDWVQSPDIRSATTFDPDGNYLCQITGTNGYVVNLEGKWQVKNGSLIDTITKCSQTNIHVPSNSHGRIIHLSDRECVVKFDLSPGESVAHKVAP